jgi:hypothetical protein
MGGITETIVCPQQVSFQVGVGEVTPKQFKKQFFLHLMIVLNFTVFFMQIWSFFISLLLNQCTSTFMNYGLPVEMKLLVL